MAKTLWFIKAQSVSRGHGAVVSAEQMKKGFALLMVNIVKLK